MRFTLDGEQFELTPEIVRASLRGQSPESIRDHWVEIDGTRWPVKQVISLATGVSDRQRFQSQRSRSLLRRLDFVLGSNQQAAQPVNHRAEASTHPIALVDRPSGPKADIVLVSCVKTKRREGAPAKDLYVSDYFTKMRTYAERAGVPWFILSAEHGLVSPEAWLEPYERYLPDLAPDERRAWGRRVVNQLEDAVGPLAGLVIDIHAGAPYVGAVEEPLRAAGAQVLDQFKGLSIGQRKSWYLHNEGFASGSTVVMRLRNRELAMTPADFLATKGAGLRAPGMYSWWVEEVGAEDLSHGLGHVVEPGLIYAGLAGATRSGGASSTNTLWGRIATMHLGKQSEFSTLRLSLGAILADAHGQETIDEGQLTRWMHTHLRVNPAVVPDADTLGDLETEILAQLDPPLNLSKVVSSPLRQRLSALRKQYGNQ